MNKQDMTVWAVSAMVSLGGVFMVVVVAAKGMGY